MRWHIKKVIAFSILIVFLVGLFSLLYFVSLEEVVEKIGVGNGYLIAFIVSFFGGFSAGGSISFIIVLITCVAGGLNPLYLVIVAGISLVIVDLLMFYIGSKGRDLIKGRLHKGLVNVAEFFKKRQWLNKTIPFIMYAYIGLTPFPNDIIILFLAMIKFPAKKIYLPIILGDLTFTLTVTLLTAQGIGLFA